MNKILEGTKTLSAQFTMAFFLNTNQDLGCYCQSILHMTIYCQSTDQTQVIIKLHTVYCAKQTSLFTLHYNKRQLSGFPFIERLKGQKRMNKSKQETKYWMRRTSLKKNSDGMINKTTLPYITGTTEKIERML